MTHWLLYAQSSFCRHGGQFGPLLMVRSGILLEQVQPTDGSAHVFNFAGSLDQLTRPISVTVQRWSAEPFINDDPKIRHINPHPHPVSVLRRPAWGGALLLAGTETDATHPGKLNGAIGAAYRVLSQLA
jgi:hypothetical protein